MIKKKQKKKERGREEERKEEREGKEEKGWAWLCPTAIPDSKAEAGRSHVQVQPGLWG